MAFMAMVVFTVILLLSPQTWFPILGKLRLAFLAAGAAAALLLWKRWKGRESLLKLTPEMVAAMILLAWIVLTLPLSYWPGGSVAILTDLYIKALLAFWLLANIVTTVDRIRFLATVLILCTVPIAVTAFRHFAAGDFLATSHPAIGRISGYQAALTSNPNDLALMLNLILPLVIANFLSTTRPFIRLLYLAAIAINVLGVVLTFSRGGFLCLATIGLVYFVKLVRRPGSDRAWAFAVLLLVLLSLPLLPSVYVNRVSTMTDIKADPTGSSQARIRDQVAAIHFVMKHPIAGAGIGMDILALNEERGPRWSMVHNAYFQYAVDLGLPGFILFLFLQWNVFRAVRSARRLAAPVPALRDLSYLAEGLEVSLIVFAVAALFHPVAYNFFFYYIAGLALAARSAARSAVNGAVSAADSQPFLLRVNADSRLARQTA
jgi:hypothetical protein